MQRLVFCSRYHKELPGLDAPPMPGKAGERIFKEVSRAGLGRMAKETDDANQ